VVDCFIDRIDCNNSHAVTEGRWQ